MRTSSNHSPKINRTLNRNAFYKGRLVFNQKKGQGSGDKFKKLQQTIVKQLIMVLFYRHDILLRFWSNENRGEG